MLWLADSLTGYRSEQEARFREWERDVYYYQRLARQVRTEAFSEAFAWIEQVVGSGVRWSLRGFSSLIRRYRCRHMKRVTIRELSALSDEMLEDIGLTRSEIPVIATAVANGTMDGRGRLHGVVMRRNSEAVAAGQTTAARSTSEWQRAA